MFPNFLGIGVQRAATTWLANCLREHPEIFVPVQKELSFFDLNYALGADFYAAAFKDAGGYKAVGEITPNYIYCKKCPERISEILPGVRMVVILRNPVERAFSEYRFSARFGESSSFEAAIANNPDMLNKGLYARQLRRFFAFHPLENLLILVYEELLENNLGTIQAVFEFLSVRSTFRPSWTGKLVNAVTLLKIDPALAPPFLKMARKWTRGTSLDSLVRKILLRHKMKSPTGIHPETKRRLLDFYRIPNRELEELLERDFSAWNE